MHDGSLAALEHFYASTYAPSPFIQANRLSGKSCRAFKSSWCHWSCSPFQHLHSNSFASQVETSCRRETPASQEDKEEEVRRRVERRWKEEWGRKRGHAFMSLCLFDHRAPRRSHLNNGSCVCVPSQIRPFPLVSAPFSCPLVAAPFSPPPLVPFCLRTQRPLCPDERERR